MAAPQNYVSVSRRPPDIEDYIDILRRHRSWIIGPTFAGLVISVVVAFLWADTYRSTAVMRITPQLISQRLVPAEISTQIGERLNQMQQEILSRGNLSTLVKTLDLYPKEQKQKPMEDIVQDMRNRYIRIVALGAPTPGERFATAFSVSFDYTDRYKAQLVVSDLVARFMNQNVRVQRDQARQTNDFLNDEFKTAKEHLDELGVKITKFKLANAGRLPEQANANVQTLNSLQMQAGQLSESISRAEASKMSIDTQLSNLQNDVAFYSNRAEEILTLPGQSSATAKNERIAELDRNIIRLKGELSSLKRSYKENYPLIGIAQAQIETYQKEKDDALKEESTQQAARAAAAPSSAPTQVRVANAGVQQRLEELKGSINSTKVTLTTVQREIDLRNKQLADVNRRIGEYQARIEASPLNEQEYARLVGDYNLAKAEYDDKVRKRGESATVQNLEDRKGGEALEVLDAPSLPETSFEPHRSSWIGMGTAMGLMIGVVFAAAKEVKNTSLKNLKDVRAYTNLPVLSSVPLLENALLVRRKRRLFWLAWSSAFIVGSVAMAVAMYYHYFGKA